MKLPIYMDNHATTPLDPRVLDAMLPYFTEKFGNAASRNHTFGFDAENAVEQARKQVASLIGADHREIVFTSGATESDNLAVKGVAAMYREKGNHIITCVTEHKAILDSCKHLEKEGYKVTFLPVDNKGLINLDDLRAAIADKTILITIMAANNEVGVIQKESSIYETQPWGFDDQPWFLNQVLEVSTPKTPIELLSLIKSIEVKAGRTPSEKWHARHIDIDILLREDLVMKESAIEIPHPLLHTRNFVLVPLMELIPEQLHPALGKTIEELYLDCRDTGEVYIFNADEQGDPL